MTRVGECIYCGQSATIEVRETATTEEENKETTMICECLQAEKYRKI